jgi:hypothetical protein
MPSRGCLNSRPNYAVWQHSGQSKPSLFGTSLFFGLFRGLFLRKMVKFKRKMGLHFRTKTVNINYKYAPILSLRSGERVKFMVINCFGQARLKNMKVSMCALHKACLLKTNVLARSQETLNVNSLNEKEE